MKPANFAPVYAGLYPELAEIARSNGYAMAVHGTMGRDADLVCIPWVDSASDPQKVVDDILAEFAFSTLPDDPTTREHGRIVYTLAYVGSCFIDLSFMPRHPAQRQAFEAWFNAFGDPPASPKPTDTAEKEGKA